MTCIAWDGFTLAADKRACSNGLISVVTKVWSVQVPIGDRGCSETVLCAGSGDLGFVMQMLDWVRGGRDPAKFPSDQRNKDDWQPFLVIEANGRPAQYERSPSPIRFEQQCVAMGSGREVARTAMHLGKTAPEAVRVACELMCDCGNGVDWVRLDGAYSKTTV